jgi:hypothetical protein
MSIDQFVSKRVTRSYRQTINAAPETIFPLLCPEREIEWLDGWDYNKIYSDSGYAEEGSVFGTSNPGEKETIWVITKHDKETYEVHFTRFTPSSRTCVLKIKIIPKDSAQSFVDISYTFTGIAQHGNEFVDSYTEEKFVTFMQFWEKAMNHFIATGRMLTRE